jgi:colanic acid biosynthesis glycosyl transferase WcaI
LSTTGLRVALITSNYWPEKTGIGQVTTEIANFLARQDVAVSVITALPYYPEWAIYPNYRGRIFASERDGNTVVHRSWHYSRRNPTALGRILHEATLCGLSLPRLIRVLNQSDVALIVSPDLSLAFLGSGIARMLSVPVILDIQDVMPDAAVELGMLRNPVAVALARRMVRKLYSWVDMIYTLSEGMAAKITATGVPVTKVHLLPNTVAVDEFLQAGDQGKPFRDEFVPPGTFAVVHAGNMGEKQDLGVLLRAARILLKEQEIRFYVVGDGAVRDRVETQCKEWRLSNVTLLPFQPRAMLPHMLYGADVLLVSQKPEVIDTVVPSKLITAMAAGAMIVATCSSSSETARLLGESESGIVVPPSDEAALVEALLRIRSGNFPVAENRARASRFATLHFDRSAIYARLLKTLSHYGRNLPAASS